MYTCAMIRRNSTILFLVTFALFLAACNARVPHFEGPASDYILDLTDLPGSYRSLPDLSGALPNEQQFILRLDSAAEQYLAESGRIEGWFKTYDHTPNRDGYPQLIVTIVELFETPAGPLLALDPAWNFDLPVVARGQAERLYSPRLDPEASLAIAQLSVQPVGAWTTLHLSVAHGNALIILQANGLTQEVSLDYLIDLAELQIEKMDG